MKKAFIHLSLIVGISIVLGGIYNFAISSSANYLSLKVTKGRYDSVKKCEETTGAGNAIPETGTPSVAPATTPPATGTPDPVEPGTPAEKKNPTPTEDEEQTPRILVDEAFEEYESGSLFIDARRTKAYVKGHIPGAVSISPWENTREERVAQVAEKEDPGAPVVVYCTRSKDCEDSEMISGDLKSLGFTNVLIFQGGFPVWQEQEKPVIEGEDPGERPGQ
ncbi:MAG: rhodanese-like domain-containing protein [Planctomycetota bacterium]|nr:rhodanese-like domain-containing protein [Planctomycetota bacterium]